jgi:undecaprenyl-diphosphatase
MLDTLVRWDTDLIIWLNSMHSPFWDSFMYIYSDKWTWVPMYFVILYVLLVKYGFKTKTLWLVIMFGLTITLSDSISASLIRPIVARLRPSNPLNPISHLLHFVNDYRGGRYGFPSCHASNSFALVTLLFLYFRNRKLTIFAVIWGLLNTYCRIYEGVHYPGDILAGIIVGIISATSVYYLFDYFLKFKKNETFSRLYGIIYAGLATIAIIMLFSVGNASGTI